MLTKAKLNRLRIVFNIDHLNIDIMHLVFAGDTIIFCDVNVDQVGTILR